MQAELQKTKLRTGDMVQVIAGKEKGKQGKITRIYVKTGRVLVEGLNKVKRHIKPSQMVPQGGILAKESPLHISNVMFLDPKTNKPTKLGRKRSDAKGKGPVWLRVAKASGTVLDVAQKATKSPKVEKTEKKAKKK